MACPEEVLDLAKDSSESCKGVITTSELDTTSMKDFRLELYSLPTYFRERRLGIRLIANYEESTKYFVCGVGSWHGCSSGRYTFKLQEKGERAPEVREPTCTNISAYTFEASDGDKREAFKNIFSTTFGSYLEILRSPKALFFNVEENTVNAFMVALMDAGFDVEKRGEDVRKFVFAAELAALDVEADRAKVEEKRATVFAQKLQSALTIPMSLAAKSHPTWAIVSRALEVTERFLSFKKGGK